MKRHSRSQNLLWRVHLAKFHKKKKKKGGIKQEFDIRLSEMATLSKHKKLVKETCKWGQVIIQEASINLISSLRKPDLNQKTRDAFLKDNSTTVPLWYVHTQKRTDFICTYWSAVQLKLLIYMQRLQSSRGVPKTFSEFIIGIDEEGCSLLNK